jgi:multiple sugar transport system ATP-binding protein
MNIFDARVAQGADGAGLVVLNAEEKPAFRVALAAPMTARIAGSSRGGALKLGIRPHRIAVGDQRGPAAIVISNQWLGDQTHLALDLGGCFLVAVAHGRLRHAPGERVAVGLPLAAMHAFDAGSGQALVHGLDAREAAAA